jgi:hypothetical protein
MKCIPKIAGRANVLNRYYNRDTDVFIYDDHRWILNVLFALYKDGVETPNLIYFDAHDDAVLLYRKKSELLKLIGAESLDEATEKQFGAFVDYDLSTFDDDWVTVAAELNLIKDAVCIGNRYNDNIKNSHKGLYRSEDGIEHRLYELRVDLASEKGNRGSLGDLARHEFDEIREFMDNVVNSTFILDFDLDCFTHDVSGGLVIPWFKHSFEKYILNDCKSELFIKQLLDNAKVITIAREPDCCGGIGNSNKILQMVDEYFFKGALNTSLIR